MLIILLNLLLLTNGVTTSTSSSLTGQLSVLSDNVEGNQYFITEEVNKNIIPVSFRLTNFSDSDIMKWLRIKIDGNFNLYFVFDVIKVTPLSYRPSSKGAPSELKTVTFLVESICNVKSDIDITYIRSRYFKKYSNDKFTNLESLFETCSFGKTVFKEESNLIITGLQLPCNGRLSYGSVFDSSKCGNSEVYGWQEYAANYSKQMNIDISAYKQRILLLPSKKLTCPWAGLGSVGCGSYCFVWINMNKDTAITTIAHELGHTMSLMHSNTASKEYGDYSCVMGVSGSVCYNAPQSWRLKWRDVITTLDLNTMDINKKISIDIPSHMSGQYNTFVRIIKNNKTSYFVSWRTPNTIYERDLKDFANVLSVHRTNGTVTDIIGTIILNKIKKGMSQYIEDSGLLVSFDNVIGNNAQVSLMLSGVAAPSAPPSASPPPPVRHPESPPLASPPPPVRHPESPVPSAPPVSTYIYKFEVSRQIPLGVDDEFVRNNVLIWLKNTLSTIPGAGNITIPKVFFKDKLFYSWRIIFDSMKDVSKFMVFITNQNNLEVVLFEAKTMCNSNIVIYNGQGSKVVTHRLTNNNCVKSWNSYIIVSPPPPSSSPTCFCPCACRAA